MYTGTRFKGIDYEANRSKIVDDELIFRLSSCTFESNEFIPLDEFFQFRRVRTRLSYLAEAGLDIDVMTTEQLIVTAQVSRQRAKVIVTRSEYDTELTDEWLSRIKQRLNPNCVIWTTNCTARSPKAKCLPLGLFDYYNWGEVQDIAGDMRLLIKFRKRRNVRSSTIAVCFHDPHSQDERSKARECLRRIKSTTELQVERSVIGLERYFSLLTTSEFCACPRGNGIDTHRLYEALYLGAIPIILRRHFLDCYRDLPILVIENWSDLETLDLDHESCKIRDQFYDLSRLTVSYWVREIDLSYRQENVD